MIKGTEVFTPLADDYARYRPGYPKEVLDELVREIGLTHDWVIGDIGSGTGNPARIFLEEGYQVIGIEPNREMRESCERLLVEYPAFRILDGAAESIPLESESVDLITVGQALHWFDVERAKAEFKRILRPDGWVAVMWNGRTGDSAFSREYAELAHYCTTLRPSPCNGPFVSMEDAFDRLFGSIAPYSASFPHTRRFDLEGLIGRARSSGFVPQPGAPGNVELTAMLTDLFNRHQHCGTVEFHYITQLYYGRLEE